MNLTLHFLFLLEKIDATILLLNQKLGKLYPFILAFCCSILAIIFYFPDFDLYHGYYEILDLISVDPFNSQLYNQIITAKSTDEGTLVHYQNAQYRLFIPVLLNLTKLPAHFTIVLQIACLPLFFYILYRFLVSHIQHIPTVTLLLIGFCFTFPVKSFLFLRPFYTSIAYLMLLMLMYFQNWLIRVIIIVTCSFIDERAVMFTFIILSLEYVMEQHKIKPLKPFLTFVTACLIIFVTRHYLKTQFEFELPLKMITSHTFLSNYTLMPISILTALDAGMILICVAIFSSFYKREYWKSISFTFYTIAGILASFWVMDINKSISYLFIIELLAIIYLNKVIVKKQLYYISFMVLVGNFLIPNYYIWSGSNTIYWLSPIFPKILKYLI